MTQDLSVRPIAGRIGAEISGVRLSSALPAETLKDIRAHLARHKVIFFREQQHLTDEGQEAFAAALGSPLAHPTVPVRPGTNYILELHSQHGGRANSWHTDVTFLDAYPAASILRSITVPESGGDTVWANTAAAYHDLPEPLRALADSLWAIHSNDYDYASSHSDAGDEAVRRHKTVFASSVIESVHPVVHIHPETGEPNLLLGHFVKKIKGLRLADSQRLFNTFQEYVTRLENTVRWSWRAGDVAIWDNRATQLYAINDYGRALRIMRRVTLAGERAISKDGRRSHLLNERPAAVAAE
jgi:taurine dioxygenase